jgi:hypothetical protein
MTRRAPWNKRFTDAEREAQRLEYDQRVAESMARSAEIRQKALDEALATPTLEKARRILSRDRE